MVSYSQVGRGQMSVRVWKALSWAGIPMAAEPSLIAGNRARMAGVRRRAARVMATKLITRSVIGSVVSAMTPPRVASWPGPRSSRRRTSRSAAVNWSNSTPEPRTSVPRSGWACEVVSAITLRFRMSWVVCGSMPVSPAIAWLIPAMTLRSWSGPSASALSSSSTMTVSRCGFSPEISPLVLVRNDSIVTGVDTRVASMTEPSAR